MQTSVFLSFGLHLNNTRAWLCEKLHTVCFRTDTESSKPSNKAQGEQRSRKTNAKKKAKSYERNQPLTPFSFLVQVLSADSLLAAGEEVQACGLQGRVSRILEQHPCGLFGVLHGILVALSCGIEESVQLLGAVSL